MKRSPTAKRRRTTRRNPPLDYVDLRARIKYTLDDASEALRISVDNLLAGSGRQAPIIKYTKQVAQAQEDLAYLETIESSARPRGKHPATDWSNVPKWMRETPFQRGEMAHATAARKKARHHAGTRIAELVRRYGSPIRRR